MRQSELSPRAVACLNAEARGVSAAVLDRVRAINVFVDDLPVEVWTDVIDRMSRLPPRGAWGLCLMCHGYGEAA